MILRDGQKLRIRLSNIHDIGSILEIYQRRVYLPSLLKVDNDAVIIDIGASIGDFSVLCASSLNARVLSYEPAQDAFEMLKENVQLNHLQNKIKLCQSGVSGISKNIRTGTDQYDSISIKDIFSENEIEICNLIKMDIEGAEYEVLLNTPQEILKRINAIAMECHIFDKGENLSRLKDYLIETGFDVITTGITAHNICYLYAKRQ